MDNLTFDSIRENNLLLYEYIRGSVSQGCNVETSDIDTGGVFISPINHIIGLGQSYKDELKDEKGDKTWFELNKFMRLLMTSNPTMLESLFIDDEFVLYEHPIITEIKKHRNEFITQECFKSFYGYGIAQIKKSRGLNKKIVQPIVERKNILDFCYTPYKQGSTKIKNWLDFRNMKQEYCGTVNIPNMINTFGIYYDWGMFFKNENISLSDILSNKYINLSNFIKETYNITNDEELSNWYNSQKPIGYKGIVKNIETSNELRFSSVSKDEKPICYMTFNINGYSTHCKDYKEYKDWEKNRNPIRYQSNLEKNYDSKNMAHSFRLVNMCIEIAQGKGFNVNRKNIDRDFLLDIRNHKFEYDYLIELLQYKMKEMDEAIKHSTLPLKINQKNIDDLLINIRMKQLSGEL